MSFTPFPSRATLHEARVIYAANPALFALLTLGKVAGPVRRLPRLGWMVSDPRPTRQLLLDSAHTSILGEGGVGHLWAQLLGDWIEDVFDGPGHADLRQRGKDLFTDATAREHVTRVLEQPAARLGARLRAGEALDIAGVARAWVGRMVADLLGLDVRNPEADREFRRIFAQGERLAALALGTIGSTSIRPAVIAEGRHILERMTAGVPRAYAEAGPHTLLGRCRDAGIPAREAHGLASVLLIAGTETAAAAMTRGVALLHDSGQQRLLLADRTRLPGAVREILRVTTPAPLIGRHITGSVSVAGKTMRRGERVLMLTYTGNTSAGAFDIRRPPDPRVHQLWFGAGQHLCLGAPLARVEIGYLLETLLDQGQPWRVLRRRPARRVIVPTYARLEINQ